MNYHFLIYILSKFMSAQRLKRRHVFLKKGRVGGRLGFELLDFLEQEGVILMMKMLPGYVRVTLNYSGSQPAFKEYKVLYNPRVRNFYSLAMIRKLYARRGPRILFAVLTADGIVTGQKLGPKDSGLPLFYLLRKPYKRRR